MHILSILFAKMPVVHRIIGLEVMHMSLEKTTGSVATGAIDGNAVRGLREVIVSKDSGSSTKL